MGFASADPQRSTERSIVTVLIDLSASMNTVLPKTFVTPDGQNIRTRLDALLHGLTDLISSTSEISMHTAKDFDGTAEFALGTFNGNAGPYIKWIKFPNARQTNPPFYFGKDVINIPEEGLDASGNTPLGEAILEVLPRIEERRKSIRATGLSVKRPILFVITDGEPSTNAYIEARRKLSEAEQARHLLFFGIGTYGADKELLAKLAPKSAYDLHGRPMSKLIEFLSTTTGTALASDPDAASDDIYSVLQEQWRTAYGQSETARAARNLIP